MIPIWNLSEVFENRRWLHRTKPFPHIVAQNVFRESVYRQFEIAFRRELDDGSAGLPNQHFKRDMKGYDAFGTCFGPSVSWPFKFFFSRPWHDLLVNLFGITSSGHVSGGLHHHPVGSSNGWVHNDLNPGWFVEYESEDGLIISNREVCNYGTGATYGNGFKTTEVVRVLAVLFYLNNSQWSPGDGGATGLYQRKNDDVEHPTVIIPPRNNSLLIFECTPYSLHCFLSNRSSPRNSFNMWLHCPKQQMIARWGNKALVYWD